MMTLGAQDVAKAMSKQEAQLLKLQQKVEADERAKLKVVLII